MRVLLAISIVFPLIATMSGCAAIGNFFLPPHKNTGKDDGTLRVFVDCDAKATKFGIDTGIGVALKILAAGLNKEGKRYNNQMSAQTSHLLVDKSCKGPTRLHILVLNPEDKDDSELTQKSIARSQASGTKADLSPKGIQIERYREKAWFAATFVAEPEDDAASMRLDLTSLEIRKAQAKAAALPTSTWSGVWGYLWPWMWIYELVGLFPGVDVREIAYTVEISMEGVHRSSSSVAAVPLGKTKISLGKYREFPATIDLRSTPADQRTLFAWPNDKMKPMAINVTVQLTQENAAGKAWTTLGGLIGDNSSDITKGIATVAGLDEE